MLIWLIWDVSSLPAPCGQRLELGREEFEDSCLVFACKKKSVSTRRRLRRLCHEWYLLGLWFVFGWNLFLRKGPWSRVTALLVALLVGLEPALRQNSLVSTNSALSQTPRMESRFRSNLALMVLSGWVEVLGSVFIYQQRAGIRERLKGFVCWPHP